MATERNPPDPTATDVISVDYAQRSFRMDRKSPEADKLRAVVSRKLCEFLGDYTDEVLAEYIVVLVCNGKHQNQAQEDLEAFLGDESQTFVSWLWDHLCSEVAVPKPPLSSADLKASDADMLDKDQKIHCPSNLQTPDFISSKGFLYELSNIPTNLSHSNTVEVSEKSERRFPSDASCVKLHAVRSEAQDCGVYDKSRISFDKHNEAKRDWRSSLTSCPETLTGGEQCRQYESQHQKIIKRNSGAVLCQSSCVPMANSFSRNFQPIAKETTQSRPQPARSAVPTRLSSDVINVEEAPMRRPRGNVWDRLGKPCKDDHKSMLRGKEYQFSGCKRERDHEDNIQDSRSLLVDQNPRLLATCNIQGSFDILGKSERKRKFGDNDSGKSTSFSASEVKHLQHEEKFLRKDGSLSVRYESSKSFNNSSTEAAIFPDSSHPSLKSSNIEHRLQSPGSHLNDKSVVTTAEQAPLLCNNSASAKFESTRSSTGNCNNKPMQEEIMDLKSKLLQVEMNMQNLRSKQANMSNLKPNASSGLKSHLDEDVDSRTVLVTNVHFAASREAIISHFAKCGPIVKATILTDTVTGQPKGAAFIVFASKESVDKATSLSGISFFSRILTVIRKTEMPQGFLTPSKPVAKALQPWYPQLCKGPLLRQQTTSHLQWRREDVASGDDSLSAASDAGK